MRQKLAGGILLAAGLACIGFLVLQVGPANLAGAVARAGWDGILLLCLLPVWLYVMHAWSWRYTLPPRSRKRFSLWRLTVAQAISQGISGMQPLHGAVAEPMKVWLAGGGPRERRDLAASIVLDNTTNGMAIVFLAACGCAIVLFSPALGLAAKLGIALALALLVLLLVLAVLWQRRGLVTGILRQLARFRRFAPLAARQARRAREMDAILASFWKRRPLDFVRSFLLHLVERAQGVFEFWLIFRLLGMDVDLATSLFVFVVVGTLDNLLFFVQIGGMELYTAGLLSALSLGAGSVNIAAGLFRRLRIVAWAALALALVPLARRRWGNPAAAVPNSPKEPRHAP